MNTIENIYVKKVYEEIAYHFDNTRTYKWPWVIQFLDLLKDGANVYDIGCGNGRNMLRCDNLNFIGVDNCENFVKICRQKELEVILSDITNIGLKDNSADAIICIAVLHHLSSSENRLKALLELKRLIKPGGKILLSVWSISQPGKTRRAFYNYGNNIVTWNKHGKLYERYYYIFKINEMKSLILKAGLTLIRHKYDCGNEIFIAIRGDAQR
jgi:tRNA (uracil-5-)-methyltransferase TRM9